MTITITITYTHITIMSCLLDCPLPIHSSVDQLLAVLILIDLFHPTCCLFI